MLWTHGVNKDENANADTDISNIHIRIMRLSLLDICIHIVRLLFVFTRFCDDRSTRIVANYMHGK
jgi:hypothetical protein